MNFGARALDAPIHCHFRVSRRELVGPTQQSSTDVGECISVTLGSGMSLKMSGDIRLTVAVGGKYRKLSPAVKQALLDTSLLRLISLSFS